LAAGGIISLVKSLPLIVTTFKDSMKSIKNGVGTTSTLRTEQDINMKLILAAILVLVVLIWLLPVIPVSFLGALIVVIFGFFFATVSSRMVGLVGSSNNPVSGMAIATLLIATLILKMTGSIGSAGMQGAIAIGSIICIVAALAGDTSQDLKTGYLLGATPKKQQYAEIIGVVASAIAIGGVLYLLDLAWGFGSEELGAPQATLMKMIVEGVMDGNLPWGLVLVGVCLAVVVEILGLPVLPFAIGVYLPVQLNACIMIGGLIRLFFDKMKRKDKEEVVTDGILYCSGMIAGEGLVGIILAIFAVAGMDGVINLSGLVELPSPIPELLSLLVFALMILCLLRFTIWKKRNK
jgi:putative OPT family oligopeptide transporter